MNLMEIPAAHGCHPAIAGTSCQTGPASAEFWAVISNIEGSPVHQYSIVIPSVYASDCGHMPCHTVHEHVSFMLSVRHIGCEGVISHIKLAPEDHDCLWSGPVDC